MTAYSKVSVIIPVYNRANLILRCLNSVFSQTYYPFDIIIVDDGSTDNVKEVLIPLIKNRKIIYFFQENKGQGAARNLGAKHAKGDWLAFLDSDDEWYPNKLETQLKEANNFKYGLIFTDAQYFKKEIPMGSFYNKIFKTALPKDNIYEHLLKENFIINSSVIIKKDIFYKLNGYKELDVYRTVEDYDLWLRACLITEFKGIYIPLVKYQYPTSVIKESLKRTYQGLKKIYLDNLVSFSIPIKYKPILINQYYKYSKLYKKIK